jgi:hypothetical protein
MRRACLRLKEPLSIVYADMRSLPVNSSPTACRELLHRAMSATPYDLPPATRNENFNFDDDVSSSVSMKSNDEVEISKSTGKFDGLEHFINVVNAVTANIDNGEDVSRLISGIGRLHQPNVKKLSQEKVTAVMENLLRRSEVLHSSGKYLAPHELCRLTLGLAIARYPSPPAWVRGELEKVVSDAVLEPKELARVLEAWSRWGLVNEHRDRMFARNIFEKMYDLVDRFQPRDIIATFEAMARMKMPRGYLVRRLVQIVEASPTYFSPGQLSSYLQSLAELHTLTIESSDTVLDVLLPHVHAVHSSNSRVNHRPRQVSGVMLGQILYSIGCVQHPMSHARVARLAALLIQRLPPVSGDRVSSERPLGAAIRGAWALCALEVVEAQHVLIQLLQQVFSRPPPKSQVLLRLLTETLTDIRMNWRYFDTSQCPMSNEWLQALRNCTPALSPSMTKEVSAQLNELQSAPAGATERLVANWQQGKKVGGYTCGFVDSKIEKFDIDPLSMPHEEYLATPKETEVILQVVDIDTMAEAPPILRHKHLKQGSIPAPLTIREKTSEERQAEAEARTPHWKRNYKDYIKKVQEANKNRNGDVPLDNVFDPRKKFKKTSEFTDPIPVDWAVLTGALTEDGAPDVERISFVRPFAPVKSVVNVSHWKWRRLRSAVSVAEEDVARSRRKFLLELLRPQEGRSRDAPLHKA